MFFTFDRHVLGMALLRMLSASIEFSAALIMLKLNRVDRALEVNAILAGVGPTVLIIVTAIGLAGLAGRVSLDKMLFIIIGIGLVLYGVRTM